MGDHWGNRFASLIMPVSLIYLLIPNLIFIAGWLQPWFAIPISLLLLWQLVLLLKKIGEVKFHGLHRNHVRFVGATLLIAISVTLISGIGGIGFQDSDWIKHNAVLKDLIDQPWPVYYEIDYQSVPLVYYIAFYLPAALVGKLFGWAVANLVLVVYSLIGLGLAMAWFSILIGRRSLFVPLIFVLFSGLDLIGRLFIAPKISLIRPDHSLGWAHIEWWAYAWQYSALTTQYFWVPNQAIAGWILTGLVVYGISQSCWVRYRALMFGLALLWSPFVALGVVPYLLVDLFLKWRTWREARTRYFSFENLMGLSLLIVMGLYYSAKLYQIAPKVDSGIKHGFTLALAESDREALIGFFLIIVFCILEFGLYAGLLWLRRSEWNLNSRWLLGISVVILSVLPFYQFGEMNDFLMRASIPALFVMAVLVGKTILDTSQSRRYRALLFVLFILGSVNVGIEFRRHIVGMCAPPSSMAYAEGEIAGLWDLRAEVLSADPENDFMAAQYGGGYAAPFFQYLAKHPD